MYESKKPQETIPAATFPEFALANPADFPLAKLTNTLV